MDLSIRNTGTLLDVALTLTLSLREREFWYAHWLVGVTLILTFSLREKERWGPAEHRRLGEG